MHFYTAVTLQTWTLNILVSLHHTVLSVQMVQCVLCVVQHIIRQWLGGILCPLQISPHAMLVSGIIDFSPYTQQRENFSLHLGLKQSLSLTRTH